MILLYLATQGFTCGIQMSHGIFCELISCQLSVSRDFSVKQLCEVNTFDKTAETLCSGLILYLITAKVKAFFEKDVFQICLRLAF